MVNSIKALKVFLSDCRGASGAEYALLLSLVGASLAISAFVLGDTISGSMDNMSGLIRAYPVNAYTHYM